MERSDHAERLPALPVTIVMLLMCSSGSGGGKWFVSGQALKMQSKHASAMHGIDRRKFRSETSDNMDRWKSRGGKSQRREEKRRSEKRKSQKKEDAGARKGRKVAIHRVFPMICGSGGSKNRLAKAAGGCGATWPDER